MLQTSHLPNFLLNSIFSLLVKTDIFLFNASLAMTIHVINFSFNTLPNYYNYQHLLVLWNILPLEEPSILSPFRESNNVVVLPFPFNIFIPLANL